MLLMWRTAAVVFITTFSAALGVMHAPAYDDGGLTDALFGSACTLPCFMGIQPGVTAFEDAIKLLQSNAWVGSVQIRATSAQWTWSGMQPDFLNIPPRQEEPFTLLLSVHGVVSWIGFATNAPAATFQLEFGEPSATMGILWDTFQAQPYLAGTQAVEHSISHQLRAQYSDPPFEIVAGIDCPTQRPNLWDAPVVLTVPIHPIYDDPQQQTSIYGFAHVPRGCR